MFFFLIDFQFDDVFSVDVDNILDCSTTTSFWKDQLYNRSSFLIQIYLSARDGIKRLKETIIWNEGLQTKKTKTFIRFNNTEAKFIMREVFV